MNSEGLISEINYLVSKGGREFKYNIDIKGIVAYTFNPGNDTEFIMCEIKRNGNNDEYLFEQVLNYIKNQDGITYIINWSKVSSFRKIHKSVFRGSNLQDVIQKFMVNKNDHDYVIWDIKLSSNPRDQINDQAERNEIFEARISSNDNRVIELESKIMQMASSTSQNHTVHFNYSISDSGEHNMNIYTYNFRTSVKFLLFTTESYIQDVVESQCEMLNRAITYMKHTTDPKESRTYKVEWKFPNDERISTSMFYDYTIQKTVDKIFTGNSNIIVISMTFIPIPMS